MPLLVNLRNLEQESRNEVGELTGEELGLSNLDELVHTPLPLKYDLEVSLLEGGFLAHGLLEMTLDCECARCLKPYKMEIVEESWACHMPMEGEDAVVLVNDCVDLTPAIREHMLLEFPQHPVCGPECQGWKKPVEKPEVGKVADGMSETPSPWAKLDKLKLD